MAQDYEHLQAGERERIFLLWSQKKKQKEIAQILGRDKSTISRELRRGGKRTRRQGLIYLASEAQERAVERSAYSRKTPYIRKILGLRHYIENQLQIGWSPEQIAGVMKHQRQDFYLNYGSIYHYIYSREGVGKRLGRYLRQPRLFRCHHHQRRPQKAIIVDRVDITLRPKEVEYRREFGHWEGDTMFFKGRQGLATQIERKSRYIIAGTVKDQAAATRTDYLRGRFKSLPFGAVKTFTFDNGGEFAGHKEITQELRAGVYFAEPYKAWQKGSIENANGLIRWFLPRKTNLNELGFLKLDEIIHLLNQRPRKCLNYQTPEEVFAQELQNLT